jgi:uncharacterized protein YfiM (DUF2279 family)
MPQLAADLRAAPFEPYGISVRAVWLPLMDCGIRGRMFLSSMASETRPQRARHLPLGLVVFALCLAAFPAHSQDPDSVPRPPAREPHALPKVIVYTSAFYTASLLVLAQTWYQDRQRVPFHFYNDNRAYLQVDKAGHAFGAYVYSYAAYHALLRSGFTRNQALTFGATAGAILQAPVEIMDGVHEGYGFSWGDVAANSLGAVVVLGQELLFGEQAAKLKFSYRPSSYARRANGYLGTSALDRLLTDYNGHTYWLSAPAARLLGTDALPPWLNVAAGYGAEGMYGEFENITSYRGVEIPQARRRRQVLLSLDVDWTRIDTRSRRLKVVGRALTMVKLPFPAIEYSSGRLQTHGLFY